MNNFTNDLGGLSDPLQYNRKISLQNKQTDELLAFYEAIYKIRKCEEVIGDLSKQKIVKTPVHLGIGQEAIAVGVSANLRTTDRVFSNHRGHSHYISCGASIEALFAEILGKQTGASRGMGGSMHLVDRASGFWGSVPIVGGTIPIAVGAALASKQLDDQSVAVAYFGDGACEEGVLHEALNLAKVMTLPVLFVCENNLFSSHMDMFLRQPSNKVARFAEAHKIEAYSIDGNDVVEVERTAKRAVDKLRSGSGPVFIEAVTHRWRGHVGPEVDMDVGVERSSTQLDLWQKRDPLRRLGDALVDLRNLSEVDLCDIRDRTDNAINRALKNALEAPAASAANLLDFVYAS